MNPNPSETGSATEAPGAKSALTGAGSPVPTAWTNGSTEVFHTGTWRSAIARHVKAPSPCQVACPVNHDIAEWIGAARKGDLRASFDILARNNPFPAVTGRVCHHPCEPACNRVGYDQPVSIRQLERYVGDSAATEGWTFEPVELRSAARVAVIGGGPSGLAAAFHLRRRGIAVTVYEARSELGGVMRYGIPAYRLPRKVLDAEIARIVALGVEVRLSAPVVTPEAFAALRKDYDAVYVATGAGVPRRLPALEGIPNVLDGAAYLAEANAGTPPPLGRRLCVIGGGSAAIDVARTARRAGHDVTVLALEREEALPAQRAEIVQTREEGVELRTGATLTRAIPGATGLRLECMEVRSVKGAGGGFSFETRPGSDFAFEVDAIVAAIGQDPDLAPFAGAVATRGQLIEVDAHQMNKAEAVYAGGDVTSMARFVTEAFGMGKRAAIAIVERLGATVTAPDAEVFRGARRVGAVVPLKAIATAYHTHQPRAPEVQLAAAERLTAADLEVEQGFDAAAALAEGDRCFSCGTCIDCDNCVVVCPDLAVVRGPTGYTVLADYCKGCGLCVRECPTGSMDMVEESR